MALKQRTAYDWRILEPGVVDYSTAKRELSVIESPNFPGGGIWGSKPNIVFKSELANKCAFYSEGYYACSIQLQQAGSSGGTGIGGGTIYGSGDPVALAPDFAANWLFTSQFDWGSEPVEQPLSLREVSMRVYTWLNYSKDYSEFMRGYNDLVYLDGPGGTQKTVSGTYSVTGTLLTSTAGTDANSYYTNEVYSSNSTGTTLNSNLVESSVAVATVRGLRYTGSTDTVPTGNMSLNVSILASALQNALDLSDGFWQRQTITDAGKIAALRLPLRRNHTFFNSYRDMLYGQTARFTLIANNVAANNSIQRDATTPAAQIYMVDLKLCVPTRQPTPELAIALRETLESDTAAGFQWEYPWTQNVGTWASGQTTFNASTAAPSDLFDFIIITAQPDTYVNNQQANCYCSIFPPPLNNATLEANGSVFQNAYITIGGTQYPQTAYGTYSSDRGGQIWDAYLEAAGRTEYQMLAPSLNRMQFENGQQLLVFDTRGHPGGVPLTSQNIQVSLRTYNGMAATSAVFLTAICRPISNFRAREGRMFYEKVAGGTSLTPSFAN